MLKFILKDFDILKHKGYIIDKDYIGKYGMRYGIYAIGNEMQIPNDLTENPHTLRIKINGKGIK